MTAPGERLFVAIPIPDVQRRAIAALIAQLRSAPGADAARWVDADTLHITLRFIGDTPIDGIARLADALADAVADRPAFSLAPDRLGAFPPHGSAAPAVIWLGLRPEPALDAVHQAIDAAMTTLGHGEDRLPFHPHLTLARVRARARGARRLRALADTPLEPTIDPFAVTAVTLYASELRADGPRYTAVRELPLVTAA